jgi:hypothetical protein
MPYFSRIQLLTDCGHSKSESERLLFKRWSAGSRGQGCSWNSSHLCQHRGNHSLYRRLHPNQKGKNNAYIGIYQFSWKSHIVTRYTNI